MARIETVDYERMPGQANEMRGEAKILNKELSAAYESINNMRNLWYGKRYNDLVQAFNNIIPSINEMLTLVVRDVPSALETIANNYSQVDCGQKVVAVNSEEPNRVQEIEVSSEVGMRFLTAEVSEVKQKVSTNFMNAKDLMDRIETIYSKVVWESASAEEFKTKFTKLKNSIVASFENINKEFKELMEQTEKDIELAEKANNVN